MKTALWSRALVNGWEVKRFCVWVKKEAEKGWKKKKCEGWKGSKERKGEE